MKKTIQDIESMALLYMEEEIFEFEQTLAKSTEPRSTKSNLISQLFGYEAYMSCLSDNDTIGDYAYLHEEIDAFIIRYDKCSIDDIDRDSEYYKILTPRIADGKFKAVQEMYKLYLDRGIYNYKALDTSVDSFAIKHAFDKYNDYRSWAKHTNTLIIVQAIESFNRDKTDNGKRSVNYLVNNSKFYNSLKLVSMSEDEDNFPQASTLANYCSEHKKE